MTEPVFVDPIPKPVKRAKRRRGSVSLPDPLGLPYCAGPDAGLSGRCWGALQRHHVKRRSQGGTDEPENIVLLCLEHHTGGSGVHSNVALAKSLGLLA